MNKQLTEKELSDLESSVGALACRDLEGLKKYKQKRMAEIKELRRQKDLATIKA